MLGMTPTPFGAVPGLEADAVTVNPYMGADTLTVFAEAARDTNSHIFILVRTSNPGAADIEDLDAGGVPVWEHTAALVARLGAGAVVGATQPEHIARMRELMPDAIFLLPGVGAQGGRVEDLAPAFAPGRHFGLVTSSRSIVGAGGGESGHAEAARAAAAELRETAWSIG
jgi:orotidine-5'-phosphate decarboxylase